MECTHPHDLLNQALVHPHGWWVHGLMTKDEARVITRQAPLRNLSLRFVGMGSGSNMVIVGVTRNMVRRP